MTKIDIVFLAGFEDDEAIVEVNDEKITCPSLDTNYSIGLAKIVSFEKDTPQAALQIKLPKRNQTIIMNVDLKEDVSIGVNLTPEGQIKTEVGTKVNEFF